MRTPAVLALLARCFALSALAAALCCAAGPAPRPRARVVRRLPPPAPRVHAPPPSTVGRIEDPSERALDTVLADLARAEAADPSGRVAVVQLGDSHTEVDFFSARMRRRLQARFGDAGRGLVVPAPASAATRAHDVAVGSSGPWTVDAGPVAGAHGPLGLGGVRVHANRAGAVLWFEPCAICGSGQRVSRFDVLTRRAVGAGLLEARVDRGAWVPVNLRLARGSEPASAPHYYSVRVPDGGHRLELRPRGRGDVEVFGAVLEREHPGVVVDALGLVGARASDVLGWDWSLVGDQLGHRNPSLVLLWYGTADAITNRVDGAALRADTVALIAHVRAAAPRASVVVMGPPELRARVEGVGAPQWLVPDALRVTREAQRRAARAAGAGYFDVALAMTLGPAGGVPVREDPAMLDADHVHLTPRGYEWLADVFVDELLRHYAERNHPAR